MSRYSEQNSQLFAFFEFFTKKLRLSKPWNYKIPLLISIPYFVFLIGNVSSFHPFNSILASIIVVIGVAGLGYLTNDLGDRKKDALISKDNFSNNLSPYLIIFLIFTFILLTFLPWLYLPFNIKSFYLLLFLNREILSIL